jgi:hypothetical protein
MNAKRHRTGSNAVIEPIVSFICEKNSDATRTDIQTLTSQLKTQFRTRQPKWNGKVLFRTMYTANERFIIYDVMSQKTIKELGNSEEEESCGIIQHNNSFAYISPGKGAIYELDMELKCKTVYKGSRLIFLTKLFNESVAIGTKEKIVIVDKLWREYKTINTPDTWCLVQLKDGGLAGIHASSHYGENPYLTIWNKDYEATSQPTLLPSHSALSIVELPNGNMCAIGFQDSVMIDRKTLNCEIGPSYLQVISLENGMHVAFERSKINVFNGSVLVREIFGFDIYSTWDGAAVEVSPGVIAWQTEQLIMCYDVVRGKPVTGFPKQLYRSRVMLRSIIMD